MPRAAGRDEPSGWASPRSAGRADPLTGRRASRLLRARRDQQQAWARLHQERLSLDPEVALGEERGLLGALILDPDMIGVMAPLRPPAWFTDEGCLAVMRALFCVRRWRVDVDAVVETLEWHNALELAGGRAAVEELVRPGPHLDAGRAALDDARAGMRPIEEEAIVRMAERLLDAKPSRTSVGDLPGP